MNILQLTEMARHNYLKDYELRISCQYLGSEIDYIIEGWRVVDGTLVFTISDNPKQIYNEQDGQNNHQDTALHMKGAPGIISTCEEIIPIIQAPFPPETRILAELTIESGSFMFNIEDLCIDNNEKFVFLIAPDAEMVYEALYEEKKGVQYSMLRHLGLSYRDLQQMVNDPFSEHGIMELNPDMEGTASLLPALCTRILEELSEGTTRSSPTAKFMRETVDGIWGWYKDAAAKPGSTWPPPAEKKCKREDHVPGLATARNLLERQHYIQQSKGLFTLTEKGREVLEHGGFHRRFLAQIFKEFTTDSDWSQPTNLTTKMFIGTFLLTLFLMHEAKDLQPPFDLLAQHTMNMFPYSRTPDRTEHGLLIYPMNENFNDHMTTYQYIHKISPLLVNFSLATLNKNPKCTERGLAWRASLVQSTNFFKQFIRFKR